MSYDSYRPDHDFRRDPGRRVRDGGQDVMFWRREQPAERNGRSASDDILVSDTVGPHSPSTSHVREGLIQRPRANSIAFPESRTNGASARPNLFSHHSSSAQPSPISNAFSGPRRDPEQPKESSRPHPFLSTSPSTNVPITSQATDPRLRHRSQSTKLIQSPCLSPDMAPSDGDAESSDPSQILKDFIYATSNRNEIKKEISQLVAKRNRTRNQHEAATKAFPKGNTYIDQLQEDVKKAEALVDDRERQLERTKTQQIKAMRAFTGFNQGSDALSSEVADLKKQLAEEKKFCAEEQDRSRQQISQLAATVERLSDQVNKQAQTATDKATADRSLGSLVSENTERLLRLERELCNLPNVDLDALRTEVKTQKLALARVNDVFATSDALNSLKIQLDKQNEQIISITAQNNKSADKVVTHSDLEAYVARFNDFQVKIDDKFAKLEEHLVVTPVGSDLYAKKSDLDQHAQKVSYQQKSIDEASNRTRGWEAMLHKLGSDIASGAAKYDASHNIMTQLSRVVPDLLKRVIALEGLVMGPTGLSREEMNKLGENLATLQQKLLTFDRVSKGNSHSIDSLNQRFNNLSTDHLARQIAGVIEPMLTTLKPQVTEMEQQVQMVSQSQKRLQDQLGTFVQKLSSIDKKQKTWQTALDQLKDKHETVGAKLSAIEDQSKVIGVQLQQDHEQHLKDIKQTTANELAQIQENNSDTRGRLEQLIETTKESLDTSMTTNIERLDKSRELLSQELNTAKDDIDVRFVELVDQVKEARDGIESRLRIIEDRSFRKSKDNVTPKQTTSLVQSTHSGHTSGPGNTPAVNGKGAKSSPLATGGSKVVAVENKHRPLAKLSSLTVQRANATHASPLIKHFSLQEDSDNLYDTIDATPTSASKSTNHVGNSQPICIDMSESSDVEQEHYAEILPSDSETELKKWQKNPASDTTMLTPKTVGGISSVKAGRHAASVKNVANTGKPPSERKRKRELSNATSKTSQSGNVSSRSTPQSSSTGRKKSKK